MGGRTSESPEHRRIKLNVESFLRNISENQAVKKEYLESGHETDVFSVTYKGVTIVVEVIWALQRAHIYSDFLILANSFARIKLLIINHEFFDEKNKQRYKDIKREYDKLRISEIRKGYIISEPFDSSLILANNMDDIKDFLDYSLSILSADDTVYEKHLKDFKDHIVMPLRLYMKQNQFKIDEILQLVNPDFFMIT